MIGDSTTRIETIRNRVDRFSFRIYHDGFNTFLGAGAHTYASLDLAGATKLAEALVAYLKQHPEVQEEACK